MPWTLIAAAHRILDGINEHVGRAVAWLTLFMVLVTFGVVVARYGFDAGSIAVQESVMYLHALVFMLGAGYTLRHDGHVRVDMVYRRLSPRARQWVDLLGTVLLLFPVCGFILWVAWDDVAASWAVREGSQEAGGLPWFWLLKTVVLVMPVLLMVQGAAWVLRAVLVLAGRLPPPGEEAEVQEI